MKNGRLVAATSILASSALLLGACSSSSKAQPKKTTTTMKAVTCPSRSARQSVPRLITTRPLVLRADSMQPTSSSKSRLRVGLLASMRSSSARMLRRLDRFDQPARSTSASTQCSTTLAWPTSAGFSRCYKTSPTLVFQTLTWVTMATHLSGTTRVMPRITRTPPPISSTHSFQTSTPHQARCSPTPPLLRQEPL